MSYDDIERQVPFAFLLQCIHAGLYAGARMAGETGPLFRWANDDESDGKGIRERIESIRQQFMTEDNDEWQD